MGLSSSELCPPSEAVPPATEAEANTQLARFAKAMGHPARVEIMRFLLRQEGCMVGAIVESLPLAQSTVSQHLKCLKDAGLIRGEVEGPRTCYCVDPEALSLFKRLVESIGS